MTQHALIAHIPVLTAYFAGKLMHCLQKVSILPGKGHKVCMHIQDVV